MSGFAYYGILGAIVGACAVYFWRRSKSNGGKNGEDV